MKRRKLSVRFMSVFLVLCMAILAAAPAAAKNGPSTGKASYAFINLSSEKMTYRIMSHAGKKTSKVKGVSYNEKTNTLTLNNVSKADYILSANEIGDDFKVQLKGKNKLQSIVVYGFGWGGNVEICGSGSLELNKNKKDTPFVMYAESTQGKITVSPEATVTAYKGKKQDYIIAIEGSKAKSAPLDIQGKVTTKLQRSKNSGKAKEKATIFCIDGSSLDTRTLTELKKKGDSAQYASWATHGFTSDLGYDKEGYDYYYIYKIVKCNGVNGNKLAVPELVTKKIPSAYTETGKTLSDVPYYDGSASSGYLIKKKGSNAKYAWKGFYDPNKNKFVYDLYQTLGSFKATPYPSDKNKADIYVLGSKVKGAPSGDVDAIDKSKTYSAQMKETGYYNWYYTNSTLKIKPVKAYTVKFNANGGKKLNRTSMKVASGKKIKTMPTVGKKGYTLKGWYTAKKGGSKVTTKTKITKNRTLYAQWTKVSMKKKPTGLTAKADGNKKITVEFKKSAGAKGYQIVYGTDKNFKGAKKVTTASTKKAISNLTAGKTCYVKVRAYKTDSLGNKVYGKYSAKAKVKVK